MILRSLREWDYLPVDDPADERSVSRATADSLLAAARDSGLGGADGEAVLVDGRRRLRVQQVVGVLVSRDCRLEILPKIDGLDDGATRRNLVHMLARVYDLAIAGGELAELDSQQQDLLEVLIRLFTDRLFLAVRGGLPRRYVTCAEDLASLRGRLDVQRQFTVLAASPQHLASRFEELSPDIPLNQIVAACIRRLRSLARSAQNQRRLAELAFAYAEVSAIGAAALPWDKVQLDRTNSAWTGIIAWARLLLGRRYQTTSLGGSEGFSLLFEMNTLFEEFVGRTLKQSLAATELQVRLQGPQDHVLEAEDGKLRFATRPDIVISRGGRPVLIVDTKWKRLSAAIDDPKQGVSQADVYQMLAYAQVYGCERLLLLYPHHRALGLQGRRSSNLIRGTAGARLFVGTVELDDLRTAGEHLSALAQLCC